MDRLGPFREIICRVIEEFAQFKPSHGEIETEVVLDQVHDHYELKHVGWDGARRVHGTVVHIDLRGGKVWVQYDGTSRSVAEALVEAGIPRKSIVLGFQPSTVRQHTEFASG